MINREKKDVPAFVVEDRGYSATAWYVEDIAESKGDAVIEIRGPDAQVVREFLFPAYKIWNIAAHFKDIVDSELAKNTDGYRYPPRVLVRHSVAGSGVDLASICNFETIEEANKERDLIAAIVNSFRHD